MGSQARCPRHPHGGRKLVALEDARALMLGLTEQYVGELAEDNRASVKDAWSGVLIEKQTRLCLRVEGTRALFG